MAPPPRNCRGCRAMDGKGLLLAAGSALLCSATLLAAAPRVPTRGGEGVTVARRSARATDAELMSLLSRTGSRVHFPTATFAMGSSDEERLQAYIQCGAEILGKTCDASRFDNEGPRRRIRVEAFTLDRYEVTVAAYAACVRARRCSPIPYYKGAARFRRDRYPASLVTWQNAVEYCSFVQARLPNEAEFERAARGVNGRRYPWGNLYNSMVSNHGRLASDPTDASDGYAELAPVGSFPSGATPQGVFDLAGNVEEWVADSYADTYVAQDQSDPLDRSAPDGQPYRSLRGGGFASAPVALRGAWRNFALPTQRSPAIGFRCARSVPH